MAGGDISLVCIIEDVIFILSLSLRKCLQVAMIRPRGVRPRIFGQRHLFSLRRKSSYLVSIHIQKHSCPRNISGYAILKISSLMKFPFTHCFALPQPPPPSPLHISHFCPASPYPKDFSLAPPWRRKRPPCSSLIRTTVFLPPFHASQTIVAILPSIFPTTIVTGLPSPLDHNTFQQPQHFSTTTTMSLSSTYCQLSIFTTTTTTSNSIKPHTSIFTNWSSYQQPQQCQHHRHIVRLWSHHSTCTGTTTTRSSTTTQNGQESPSISVRTI